MTYNIMGKKERKREWETSRNGGGNLIEWEIGNRDVGERGKKEK